MRASLKGPRGQDRENKNRQLDLGWPFVKQKTISRFELDKVGYIRITVRIASVFPKYLLLLSIQSQNIKKSLFP